MIQTNETSVMSLSEIKYKFHLLLLRIIMQVKPLYISYFAYITGIISISKDITRIVNLQKKTVFLLKSIYSATKNRRAAGQLHHQLPVGIQQLKVQEPHCRVPLLCRHRGCGTGTQRFPHLALYRLHRHPLHVLQNRSGRRGLSVEFLCPQILQAPSGRGGATLRSRRDGLKFKE